MKIMRSLVAICVLSLLILASCSADKKYATTKIKTKDDSVSYFLGLTYGSGLKQAGIDSLFDYNAFMKGVVEASKADSIKVSQYEVEAFLNKFFSDLQLEKMKREYKDYIAENKAFLEENAKKDSVVTLASGLQYQILREGNGPKAKVNDKVKVHYTGKMIDGTVFDSSYKQNKPIEFYPSQVIPGWKEALLMMPVGSKWKVFIPENLAYGANPPRMSGIQPFSTLVFEVEVIEVTPPQAN